MTDDYFMLPRFDRRKTIVCNGVAALFAIGCLIGHTAGVDGVWLGVEASLVLLAMAVLNALLRLLTRKPFLLEPWERDLIEARPEHLTAGEVLSFEERLGEQHMDGCINPYVSEHMRRNAENARVLAEHLGASELPDDRVIDMANGKA